MSNPQPDTPRTPHDMHDLNRLERGRPLTDDEIACYIADHQTAIRHGTAQIGDEIAEQLRDRLAASPPTAHPSRETVTCPNCGRRTLVIHEMKAHAHLQQYGCNVYHKSGPCEWQHPLAALPEPEAQP